MQTRHNQRRDKYRQQGPARCEHDLHVNVIKLHVSVHECINTFMTRPTVQNNQVFISKGLVDHLKCLIIRLYYFYGKADCASCHSGALMTDQKFHALGLPAFGPGRTRRFDPYARDVGRMSESDRLADAYAFRTPMLRNGALTAPYGHNGAYPTLEGIVRHHLDPVGTKAAWRREDAQLPDVPWLARADFLIQSDRFEMTRQQRAVGITPMHLGDAEVADLVAFLHALTGTASVTNPPFGVPQWFSED